MPKTSLYCCKLFPIFTSLPVLLTIKVVLTTTHIAIIRFSISRVFSVKLKVILKVAPRFSKITGRWRACWSRSVCLTPLYLSSLSRKVFVKQMRKNHSQTTTTTKLLMSTTYFWLFRCLYLKKKRKLHNRQQCSTSAQPQSEVESTRAVKNGTLDFFNHALFFFHSK